MSPEKPYNPTPEEIASAVGKTEEEMSEYLPSHPTTKNVNRAMTDVAAQFGEKFEGGDPAMSEEEVINKYNEEGWNLVSVLSKVEEADTAKEGKEIKIVGLGDKFLVFEKDKRDEE